MLGVGSTKPKQDRATDENAALTHETNPKLTSKEHTMAIDISGLSDIGGFIGACMVDSETGLMMASEGGGKFDLEAAGAANTEVVKAKLSAIEMLDLDDHIDDILITLGKQFHLIRPLEKSPKVFLYVALDKKAANLGMARVQVKKVEQSISL
ncbi:roadblock/LC7 domain-containing protein [Loktanella agnita]